MKKHFYLTVLLYFPSCVAFAQHQHHDDHQRSPEEMIVTSPLMKSASETIMPVNTISDEILRENAASTLGETLKNQVGISSTSYGPGVGLPIIRGQSGNRVRILQNSNGTPDVSTISQDHANSVEALLAERIEIIRGPSTLLYGNGAIGGVINIIDNRIPNSVPESNNGGIELRHNSANNGNAGIFKINGGHNNIAWHIDGLIRKNDDVKIPGYAIDEAAVEAAAHHDPEEEETPLENTNGYIANSDAQSQSLSAGISLIKDNGFFGASISQLDNKYGIPHGSHVHHEEEEPDEPTADTIHVDMQQTQVDFKGRMDLEHFIELIQLRISFNDYEHKEIEGSTIGTVFSNESNEARLTLNHSEINRIGGIIGGTMGIHLNNREFSAIGDEAFIPMSDIRSNGIFIVENLTINDWSHEFGMRFDKQVVEPSDLCKVDNNTFSASIGTIWNFNDSANFLAAINHSERSAAVEELFSNIDQSSCNEPDNHEQLVLHAASSRYEIGNPELSIETANNIELGLRKHLGYIRGEINFYRNQIDNFIYLADTQTILHESRISRYQQQNAVFTGVEVEITFPFDLTNGQHVDLTLKSDFVNAEFDNGQNVPRIPPKRLGVELAYSQKNWGAKLHVMTVSKQNDISEHEQATDGYTSVDLRYDYHTTLRSNELILFINASNLLNEEIRNHTSFLKNFSPAAKRSIEAGARYYY